MYNQILESVVIWIVVLISDNVLSFLHPDLQLDLTVTARIPPLAPVAFDTFYSFEMHVRKIFWHNCS